jgi:hypothetical protein
MTDETIRVALYVPGGIGALAVICIGVLIAVLQNPDIAALAVLASIASAAVGGVTGMITPPRQQASPPESSEKQSSARSGRTPDTARTPDAER